MVPNRSRIYHAIHAIITRKKDNDTIVPRRLLGMSCRMNLCHRQLPKQSLKRCDSCAAPLIEHNGVERYWVVELLIALTFKN